MSVPPMPRRTAYAVFAALAAVVVLVSTAIFAGVGGRDRDVNEAAQATPNSAAPAPSGSWVGPRSPSARAAARGSGVGTWSGSAAAAEPNTLRGLSGMSIRNVIHTSIGGTGARIQLCHLYSAPPPP